MENKRYTIAEAELKLREISPKFSINASNEKSDLAGVYWDGIYTEIAMPKDFIYSVRHEGHCDAFGYPHRGLDAVVDRAQTFLSRITTDKEYYEDMTTPFDINALPVGEGDEPVLLPEDQGTRSLS